MVAVGHQRDSTVVTFKIFVALLTDLLYWCQCECSLRHWAWEVSAAAASTVHSNMWLLSVSPHFRVTFCHLVLERF